MRVTFWGVRGTFPATGAKFVRYGGDTMCVEVVCGETRIILDAGSGLHPLGDKLMQQKAPIHAHMLLSHAHIDHVIGFTLFAPLWRKSTLINVWSAEGDDDDPGAAARVLLSPPFTPEGAANFPAKIEWTRIDPNGSFMLAPDVKLTATRVHHPGQACGYRIEHGGRSLCYFTDHEHGDAEVDQRLAVFARGADLVLYDATYTEQEMATRQGWGHSTWQAGVKLRDAAQATQIAFIHHEPRRSDDDIDRFAAQVAEATTNAFFARAGQSVDL